MFFVPFLVQRNIASCEWKGQTLETYEIVILKFLLVISKIIVLISRCFPDLVTHMMLSFGDILGL